MGVCRTQGAITENQMEKTVKTVKMTCTLDFYSDLWGSGASRNWGSHSGSLRNNKNDRIFERVLGSLSLRKTLGPKPLNPKPWALSP